MRKIPIRVVNPNISIFWSGWVPLSFQAKTGTIKTKDVDIKVASPVVVIFWPIVVARHPKAFSQAINMQVLEDNSDNPLSLVNSGKKKDKTNTAIPNRIVIMWRGLR